MKLKSSIEGLLFVVGEEGLALQELATILDYSLARVEENVNLLMKEYEEMDRGMRIQILGNRYKMVTRPDDKTYYQKLVEIEKQASLSQSALETLAIVAYQEPVTRSQVEAIRGVDSSHIMRRLLLLDLLKEVGKSELPGRPNLYATTPYFLDFFGLSKKEDLPKIPLEQKEPLEEQDLFQTRYKEQ